MRRHQLREELRREVDRWSARSLEELRSALAEPLSYLTEAGGHRYQTEVQLLEDEPGYVQVGVAVDDLSLRRSVLPLATSFLVHADGRVDK